MAEYVLCEKSSLDTIADSIRNKINSNEKLTFDNFNVKIDSIAKNENINIKVSSDVGVFYYQTFNELGELVWASQDYGTELNYKLSTYTLPIAKNGLVIGWKYVDHSASSDSNSIEPFLWYKKDQYYYGVWNIENKK